MQVNNFFDNGQPHAVALGGVGFVRLIELLENAVPFFGRNGAAGVRDSHPDTFRTGLDRHPDQPVFRRELDRVVQQIDPDLLQQLRIGFDLIFVKVQAQIQVFCAPSALQQQDAGADLLREIEPVCLPEDGLVFDPGKVQHIGSQGGKAHGFLFDRFQVFFLLLFGQVSTPQQGGKSGDGNDGRFELVRKIIYEIAPQHFGVLQLLRHFVEAPADLFTGGETAEPFAKTKPGPEVAGCHPIHGIDDLIHRLQRNAADQDGQAGADQNAGQRDPPEQRTHVRLDRAELQDVQADQQRANTIDKPGRQYEQHKNNARDSQIQPEPLPDSLFLGILFSAHVFFTAL